MRLGMEFAAEAVAWHLDRCSLGKTMFPTKGEGLGSVFYGRLSVARERKASCVTRALSVIVPLRSPRPWCRVFFSVPPTKRDRYPRLYYKYTCNSVSSPAVFSLCIPQRSSYLCVCIADTTHARDVHLCWGTAGTISASTYTDILLGGNRLREASEAQPFSYRFVSLRSFSPPRPSVARARARRARTGH